MPYLGKCRFMQSIRMELAEAFASILVYMGSILTSSQGTAFYGHTYVDI